MIWKYWLKQYLKSIVISALGIPPTLRNNTKYMKQGAQTTNNR